MKIKNVSSGTVTISDLPGSQSGQGLTLQTQAEHLLHDEDAEKSAQLASLMDAGLVTKLSDEEPNDSAPNADVDVAGAATDATQALADAAQAQATADAALPKAGGIMSGDIDMDGGKVIGLAAGTAPGEAARFDELDAVSTVANAAMPSANLLFLDSAPSAGGTPSEALVVTGLLATDAILAVTQVAHGSGNEALLGYNTQANDALTGVWNSDPGAGAIVRVAIKR